MLWLQRSKLKPEVVGCFETSVATKYYDVTPQNTLMLMSPAVEVTTRTSAEGIRRFLWNSNVRSLLHNSQYLPLRPQYGLFPVCFVVLLLGLYLISGMRSTCIDHYNSK
jgi:hypothetical protein